MALARTLSASNLESIVGSMFGGSNPTKNANPAAGSSSTCSSVDDLSHQSGRGRGSEKPRRTRCKSGSRLPTRTISASSNASTDASSSAKKSKRRASRKDRGGVRRTRSSSSSRLPPAHSSSFKSSFSVDDYDSKIKSIPGMSEEEIMAGIFKTAEEMDQLAKAARRANRRKSTVRRSKSHDSNQFDSVQKVNSSNDDDNDGDGMSDHSSKSHKSTKSCRSFADLFRSPFATRSDDPGTRQPRRRSSFEGFGLGIARSSSDKKLGTFTNPNAPEALNVSSEEYLVESVTVAPTKQLAADELDIYKPSFHHDSDDEDDSLVMDPDEDLDGYSLQVQQEVQNVTIVINWDASQAAQKETEPSSRCKFCVCVADTKRKEA